MTLLAEQIDFEPALGIETILDQLLERRYCIVQDDDGHCYVIPVHKMDEWFERLEKYDEDLEFENWVDRVGGAPSNVSFPSYKIL